MDDKKVEPTRVADALGTLSRRSEGPKALALAIAVGGLFLLVFLGALIFQSITGGSKTPELPKVKVY